MNLIAVIILIAIVSDYILHLVADFLNLKRLSEELPEEFSELYGADRYRKAQEYLRVNTLYGWVFATFDILVILVFWFLKGFPFIDSLARSWNFGPVITGLIFMGILIFIKALLTLPFKIYETFVIEERFGFNRTTARTFTADLIKGLFLGIIIGTPLLAGILVFFEYAGSNAWWYCWIAVTVFMLFIQFVAPAWIFPLFNKFSPVEDSELTGAIMSYAHSIHFPLKNVYMMDGSKRSGKSNAFFAGFGKNKRIVLFDTLINQHTVQELVAVLAHEMGHYKKRHIQKMLATGIIQMGVVFFLMSFFISYKELFDAFYMEHASVYAGLIFFGMLYAPIDFFMEIFLKLFSRKNEFEADRFAVQTTGNPSALSDALKKLSVSNLSNLIPHPLYVFLNYSHPPVLERIHAISRDAAQASSSNT